VLNRVSGRDPLPSLVVTFGLSIVIQNAVLTVRPQGFFPKTA
jgi:branched-chain amino acid transport system permease protein